MEDSRSCYTNYSMLKTQVKSLYEVLVILKSDLSDDDIDKNISQIESSIKNFGGSIVRIDEPLRRRLTHKIKGYKEGYNVSIIFNSPSELPSTLKRSLSIADDVLRYILIKRES